MSTVYPTCYTGPPLSEVGERATIRAILDAVPSQRNGDDAAVLPLPNPNTRTVVTTDMLVEGRHFRLDWSRATEIGHKAVVQNFADIEAMGARPVAVVLALSAPGHTPLDFITDLARGVGERVSVYSADLAGGDLTGGEHLVVSVSAIGHLGGSLAALTLDAARPGQAVVAAGHIGYSAAGLALLQRYGREGVPGEFSELVNAHLAPVPDPGRGVIARAAGASSMTDNSDGLITDLGTLARRSEVGIDLAGLAIAPDELLTAAGKLLGEDPWTWVLTGGEDHTLIGTTSKDAPSGFRVIGAVHRHCAGTDTPVTIDSVAPAHSVGWDSFPVPGATP
ncbi:thiamine-phosphate kinase [Corynebacterium sp. CCM 9185]|uniref:Thiamine-monophosphate kinase n=1 Tax=Corynebacterium marambiense TaxID=2765364 RepID=A0ABS0VXI4_9CORY|nr:thiamine-phosphate kinase [Corynebacterium marambiense]MBI9000305.1 thiamine-phosphate kinase [Corynebacterium marambiense]MCK7663660.1 thiamine-phosphate kinase [Corynebacterium marambiense]MCX7541906.1 thiamine-phosphate kinase [Corynebacterium marambiense]